MFMTRVEKQQQIANHVLQTVFPIDTDAIIAGGAPREWFFGKAASDIDVFIYDTCSYGRMWDKLKHLGFDIQVTKDGEGLPEHYKKNPHLHSLFECTINGEKVQFLQMNSPTFTSVISQFPLSICKAWYKNGKIGVDRDFKRSVKHKVIVKTNEIYADEDSYVKKVLAKFPEYRYHKSWESVAQKLLDEGI